MALERLFESQPADEEAVVALAAPIEAIVVELEDGGVEVDLDPNSPEGDGGFLENLAEVLDDNELAVIASDVVEWFDGDRRSRQDWERAYIKGLDLLGLKIEERQDPWPNACGVFHPLLTEAVVRFEAQSITELFPATGPARVSIIGEVTKERQEQARRVEKELNYQLTEKMAEYRSEMELMLFRLPLAGSAFKKIYYDPSLKRACSLFCPAEDVVVSYGASDIRSCSRVAHYMRRPANEIRKLQVVGFYRDVELPAPTPEYSDVEDKANDLLGDSPSIEDDDRHHLIEMCVELDLPGFEDPDGILLPYVVTVDKQSKTVLSIYRNWDEDDPERKTRQHFVHYQYLPGLGFYGIGLIHLIGGLAKSATSILRQLVDSGTLSNLPGGLKARGLRIRGDDSPIMPGEFRDVDVPGGAIRDSITFLPYKEPSAVLYSLLGNLVEEGRRIGSVADLQIGDMHQQAPVGTTLALIERSMKVMSAVQARLHASLKRELRLISKIIGDFLPPEYDYDLGPGDFDRRKDFDDRIDVIPVSDPNAATMSQRIMQHQAAHQLAATAPQIYDLPVLHRQMLDVMGLENSEKLVPVEDEIEAMDPVQETQALITGKPVKAFPWQDHESHIQVHMAAAQNPKIQELIGQNPQAQAIMGAAAAHISEHVAFKFRAEVEQQLGVPLPNPEEPVPPEVANELAPLIAEAVSKLLQRDVQMAKAAEDAAKSEDPLLQIERQKLDIQARQVQQRADSDARRLDLEERKLQSSERLTRERLDSDERVKGTQIGADVAVERAKLEAAQKEAGVRIGADIAKVQAQMRLERDRMEGDREEEGFRLGQDMMRDLAEMRERAEAERVRQAERREDLARAEPEEPEES